MVSLLNHFVHSDDLVAKKDSEIIVLNDAEAVGGVGHMAMLAGNDQKEWTFVASGGRAETDGSTILGGDSIPIS